ncbi:MAG TPA: hypothetical protein VM658_05820, partial [bacterium]|nr:hypothetical protein [bacterium]
VTVYPVDVAGSPTDLVDKDAAPLEVIYALIRGASYDKDEPTMSEEQALEYATQFINGAASASSQQTGAAAQVQQQRFNRDWPPALKGNATLDGWILKAQQKTTNPRFWRIQSTALTQDGLQTTITRVVKVDKMNNFSVLYYKED